MYVSVGVGYAVCALDVCCLYIRDVYTCERVVVAVAARVYIWAVIDFIRRAIDIFRLREACLHCQTLRAWVVREGEREREAR